MSRPANPYDNASCESFIKTLKREEIHARRYENLEHLRANITEFIEEYYNRQRLHSALGYRSPEEFEKQIESSNAAPDRRGATMNFFENERNDKRVSKAMVREGDSIAVHLPRTPSPADRSGESSMITAQSVNRRIVSLEGFTPQAHVQDRYNLSVPNVIFGNLRLPTVPQNQRVGLPSAACHA